MTLVLPDQRETCCYAWHGTRPSHFLGMRPSKAQSPGLSVSSTEPSGVFGLRVLSVVESFPRACLLLGQRSRMNFDSHLIRSSLFQDHGNARGQLTCHRHNGHPGGSVPRMRAANRAEKLPQLAVLTDRRPGSLDELTSKPTISSVGDRSPIGSLSGGVLHGNQAQKTCQLTDVFNLARLADPSQKLTGLCYQNQNMFAFPSSDTDKKGLDALRIPD